MIQSIHVKLLLDFGYRKLRFIPEHNGIKIYGTSISDADQSEFQIGYIADGQLFFDIDF